MDTPKKRKRGGNDEPTINKNQLLTKLEGLNPQHKAFISCIYLTGCRISELLGNKNPNKPTKPILRNQIELENYNDKEVLMFYNIPTLKRKKAKGKPIIVYRNIPILVKDEKPFVKLLLAHINELRLDQPLFSFSRVTAWRIVYKKMGLFPHYFRHLRNTHWVQNYGLSPMDLRIVNGWKDSRPADIYTHLNWRNVVDKMVRGT